jgi:hypothetical protein
MIKCPFCQFENEEGALFCEQCKLDLGANESAAAHSPALPVAEAASPTTAMAEVAGASMAVAIAEAGVTEALAVAQMDAVAAATAEVPIAVAVPLPETSPPTISAEPPGAFPDAVPAQAPQAEHPPAAPAAATAPDTSSPLTATLPEGLAPPEAAELAGSLPSGAKPKLLVLRGQRLNVEYPLYEGDNYLGRADEKAVDIDLEDQEPPDRIWSSRQHALITYENGLLTIEDLNSTNGTFVNRLRVHPGQKRSLQVNDIIQVGTVQMKVKI